MKLTRYKICLNCKNLLDMNETCLCGGEKGYKKCYKAEVNKNGMRSD